LTISLKTLARLAFHDSAPTVSVAVRIDSRGRRLTLRPHESQVIFFVVLAGFLQEFVDASFLQGSLRFGSSAKVQQPGAIGFCRWPKTHVEALLVFGEQAGAFLVVLFTTSEVLCRWSVPSQFKACCDESMHSLSLYHFKKHVS
jgi:hypothetical protein